MLYPIVSLLIFHSSFSFCESLVSAVYLTVLYNCSYFYKLKPCTHDQICIRMQILHICKICVRTQIWPCVCIYSRTHVCKICTYAKVGKFAPASDQMQISFCVYAKFAYMQIWLCEQKAKFAHVSIYFIVLNNC